MVYPVPLLLVKGSEGVKEVDGSFVCFEGSRRMGRGRERGIGRGRTVFHWWVSGRGGCLRLLRGGE